MKVEVKRIDHLGIVAGTIRDLGLVELANELLGQDEQEILASGEAVAGMMLNGLGFLTKPLMLTPQFFEYKALDILIKPGITHEHFNRHKLSRVLDRISAYGCDKFFNTIALTVCQKQNIDMRFAHCDTTSYSLSGEYDVDTDTEPIHITYGHSKDRRADLKQVVQELITTGSGIPFFTKTWDGNASDSVILQTRAETMMKEFCKSNERYLVADAKLYSSKSAPNLNMLHFITRVPRVLKQEQELVNRALNSEASWQVVDSNYKLQVFSSDCYDIKRQRWIVVYSQHAYKRARKALLRSIETEAKAINKDLHRLQAQRFGCEADARKKLTHSGKKWKYHKVSEVTMTPSKRYAKPGRPTGKDSTIQEWQIKAKIAVNQEIIDRKLAHKSCFTLATNIASLAPYEILKGYKGQDKVEKGFAFLKSPTFFASSLFLKKSSRIEALLIIMVLSLLIYSLAQLRLRQQLEALHETIPNQIKKPTAHPTMRWVFELFDGINYVIITANNEIHHIIEGMNDLKQKVIELMGGHTQKIYQVFPGG